MHFSRREFLQMIGAAGAVGMLPACGSGRGTVKSAEQLYDIPKFGNVTVMHMTDCHAQLKPVYFREPNVNLGFHDAKGRPPHLVGKHLLDHFGLSSDSPEAHAFTYLDFAEAAEKYGKVGGFDHLATLVKKIRAERGDDNTLLMDGGDTWQGSGTALWTRGEDMVDATNLLGVDVMTGHWEFTYKEKEILKNIERFDGDFVAQNVFASVDAIFEGADVHDEDSGRVFPPYVMKDVGGARVAVIGQAFPYTPIANPQRFIPDWSFGIKESEMQAVVDEVREKEKPDAVFVLSHNGADVDIKMGKRVRGIDVIFGGHTHDAIVEPVVVDSPEGQTVVSNAGSNGKFLAVMDMDIRDGKLRDFKYHLVPVFSNYLEPDKEMSRYIEKVREPYLDKLNEELAVADELMYRRGNFNGTFDQVICDAQREVGGADISLSPGFRWGTSVLPGQTITMEHVMDQTGITYPETYVREMSGEQIKMTLEDVADNLFNKDPYRQQGGDMVRVGGLDYTMDPTAKMGKRLTDLTLDNGEKLEADKKYKVAGWATVGEESDGEPIWDVVATYLRDRDTVTIDKLNTPKLKNVKGNPGIDDYDGEILS
ncbi:thiosulfohydrolase SoxB [Thiohalospira sp.]|uniref:thiosulfohydrolase SoxB n=1 Tax=Thiohalospira sp. TaxID=3080549 RepID=UPI00397ED157